MEAVMAIFAQLGIDGSIFYQFSIVILTFILARIIFLGKLQFVIEHRENKTVHLEKQAEKKLAEAMELSEKYQIVIENAYQKAHKEFVEKRNDIHSKEEESLKKSEEEVSRHMNQAKEQFLKEIEQKRKEVFANVDSLAGLLVNKISK